MTVPEGRKIYSHGVPPCSGVGLSWNPEDLESALAGSVAAFVFDDAGKANIENVLADLASTDFDEKDLMKAMPAPDKVEDWRVGEAIAVVYLSDHRLCLFPWPVAWDERAAGSSLPGADLVGIGSDDNGDCLVFGEVKTSSEARYPPSIMHGQSGLKRQLEDLAGRKSVRDQLLRYLLHRAKNAEWKSRLTQASARYLRDEHDLQIYGFMVRDVEPNKMDLKARIDAVAKIKAEHTRIEILALYLPVGCIEGIGQHLIDRHTGAKV